MTSNESNNTDATAKKDDKNESNSSDKTSPSDDGKAGDSEGAQ